MLLSYPSQQLWGKADWHDSDIWLPLYQHLADTCEIARLLWDQWLGAGVKKLLDNRHELFLFLAAAHDLGYNQEKVSR
jgi:CRISPR-associated endonuclease/helicase Cas3